MQENEFKYYEKIGNWDFSQIKSKTEKLTNWDMYEILNNVTNKDVSKPVISFTNTAIPFVPPITIFNGYINKLKEKAISIIPNIISIYFFILRSTFYLV